MDSTRLRFRKWDIAAFGAVVLLAALVFALFLPGQDGVYAQIYQDGKLIKIVPLDQDGEFEIVGRFTNTVAVRDGKIAVIRSDCPGEDCVSCGWIGGSGRSVVCLPNGLEIRVISDKTDVDFVVG